MSGGDELTLALERFDLAGYVLDHGGQRVGRAEWLLDCPKCMKPKLSVNVRERFWRCFVCERYARGADGQNRALDGAGNVFGLVRWLEGLSPADAARKIIDSTRPKWLDPSELPDLPVPQATTTSWERTPTGLPEGCIPIDGIMPYMARRGISLEDARAFGLGWCPSGWLANRLVFPVWQQGQCLYWQARAMWDGKEHEAWFPGTRFKKTLNPAVYFCGRCRVPFPDGHTRCALCSAPQQFGSADVLGNLEQAARYPRVAICEGPTSAIRAGPSAVFTFGKVLHPQQIALLLAYGVRAVDFMWDGPKEGDKNRDGSPKLDGAWPEMVMAASQLAPHIPDVRLVFLPHGDPGDWPREHLDHFRATARPFAQFDSGL